MANTPTPRSYPQTLGEMSDAFLSRFGLSGIKKGSAVLSILEAAAQSDVRNSQDIFSLLNSISLKRAKGVALDRIGADENVPRQLESKTTGSVNIGDSSFNKISTAISQASPAPIAGSVTIYVVDASLFPTSGNLYIGRGTSNYEGPLAYNGVVNNGTNWTISLTGPTVRFHNQNESVVLAQGGNRVIGSGTIVQTPQGNARDAVKFSTLYSATIPDGEVIVLNVPVVAQSPGPIGNVPASSVRQFASPPFTNATVTNTLPFTNGNKTEDDETYRERIADVLNSKSKGTPLALTTSAIGVVAPDENRKVVSATFVAGIDDQPSVLYIDDGSGYEESSTGVAIEVIVDDALGGETDFALVNHPVAKAYLQTTIAAPFTLVSGSKLAFKIGGIVSEHTFDAAEFKEIGNASAYEVVASVNANFSLTWSARTVASGTYVAFFAKTDTNEDIELATPSGIDANQWLGIPRGKTDTLKLYKNDRLLSKDGQKAIVVGNSFAFWKALSSPQSLQVSVDSTPAVTYTFTDQDFINAGTGFITLGINTLAAWASVINARIPGLTASVNQGALQLISNRGNSANARVAVTGGTLVTNGLFNISDKSGINKDYVLDRNTGQLRVGTPLAVGDHLSAGTTFTRAFLETPALTTVTLATDANLWLAIDGKAQPIKIGVSSATPLALSIPADGVKHWGDRLRITVTVGSFSNLQPGDQIVLWDTAFDASLIGVWYVARVATDGSYIEIDRSAMKSYRSDHQATRLSDNRVLFTGGFVNPKHKAATKSAEIFDPVTNTFTSIADMSIGRAGHTATLLANGKVLVYGGSQDDLAANVVGNPEIYDPGTNTWTPTAITPLLNRYQHQAVLATDNKVYISGGQIDDGSFSATTAVYDPAMDAWTLLNDMVHPRSRHTLTALAGDKVLAVMGENAFVPQITAEIYDIGAGTWTATSNNLQIARQGHRTVDLGTGFVFAVGGSTSGSNVAASNTFDTDLYNIGTDTWSNGPTMTRSRSNFGMDILANGKVVAGFGDQFAATPWVEVYDPMANTWSVATDPSGTFMRRFCTATTLPSNHIIFAGGRDTTVNFDRPRASAEIYNQPGDDWATPYPGIGSITLAVSGFDAVRSASRLVRETVAAGTNYTASSLTDVIEADLVSAAKGATISTYRTNKLRLTTNTFAAESTGTNITGDIMLAATDVSGQQIGFPKDVLITNLDGHLGSVESLSSELGTPNFFDLVWVKGSSASNKPEVSWNSILTNRASSGSHLVALHSTQDSITQTKFGDSYQFASLITSQLYDGLAYGIDYLTLRKSVEHSWIPEERAYFASPWAIGPYDNLVIVADQDVTSKRFVPNMYRKTVPVGNTYASTVTLKDNDPTSPTSLAVAFGLTYDWSDYAVFMKARGKTHDADNTKRALWRWFRHGSEGNIVQLTYEYPVAPNAPVTVVVDDLSSIATKVQIQLSGGALKTGASLRPGTYIGVTATSISSGFGHTILAIGLPITSATRAANVTTLTLGLPGAITDNGLSIGNIVYVASVDPNFTSGLYTLTGKTATTVTYAETAPDQAATPNIGTVSRDTAEATFANLSPTLATGDMMRLETTATPVPSAFKGNTYLVNAFGPQYLGFDVPGYGGATSTTLTWYLLTDVNALKIFANGSQSVATIVAAVNSLAAAANTTCPITGVVTGTGLGIVDKSSADDAGAYPAYTQFSDGINFVKSQTNPINLAGNYTFTFKDPINSALANNADWQHEDVRLVPVGVTAVSTWLMQPATSGLFTAAMAEPSSRAHNLQIHTLTPGSSGGIEVQGGSANGWTAAIRGDTVDTGNGYMVARIPIADLLGFQGSQWVSIDNTSIVPKHIFDNTSTCTSITGIGKFTFQNAGTKVWDNAATPVSNAICYVEKHGEFVCYGDTRQGSGTVDLSTVNEGDWVIISKPASPSGAPQVGDPNVGTFRIVRVVANVLDGTSAFWIENGSALEYAATEMDLRFIKRNSIMPGDTIQISTSLWGVANKGIWTVKTVGDAGGGVWTNFYTFTVDVSTKSPVAITPNVALGADYPLVQVRDLLPYRAIKQVIGTSIDQVSGIYGRIKLISDLGFENFSETAGSIITVLDKFNFPIGPADAADGYKYNIGLLHEVNKVIYGDTSDTTTYPGVAAAGAHINIQGPLVRRTPFAILVRLKSGFPVTDVESSVRSAVASVINQSPHGQPIAISDIISAAAAVVGVESVVPVSKYGVGNDLIPVQPYEKALVLNLDQDVLVSFIGI